MGYMKLLTDSTLKTDRDGNTVFYPWGKTGKGYVLPDRESGERIRRFVIWYNFAGLTVILVTGVFVGRWQYALFILLPIALLGWYIQTKRITRGLARWEEKGP